MNISKLILCGYNLDPTGTFDDAYKKKMALRPKKSVQISTLFHNTNKKVFNYMRKSFQVYASRFTSTSLGNGNLKKCLSDEAFSNLAALGLGKVVEEPLFCIKIKKNIKLSLE